MVLFKKRLKTGEHEVVVEGAEEVMHINYEEYTRLPSVEEDPLTMARAIEKLASNPVARVVFHQKKKYEYPYNQTQMLVEVGQVYNHFIKQKKLLTLAALEAFGPLEDAAGRLRNLQYIILNLLRNDPLGAYVEVRRFLREERILLEKVQGQQYALVVKPYVDVLEELQNLLEKTTLVRIAQPYLQGYVIGSREVYKVLFHPVVTPDFMVTRLAATPPLDAEEIDSYQLGKNTYVQVFNVKETVKQLYHLIPPEFQVSEDKYELIDMARKVLAQHQPKAEEFVEPEKMRENFFNIGRDLLTELADHRGLEFSFEEIEEMAAILVRYTVGFGLIEVLLSDPNVQDIAINSPVGGTPMFVVHGKYDECVTNIVPSVEDVESWATKFRLISGRPLDEANPVLDTELVLPGARARVAVISKPLNPTGLAFSLRRHRDDPWTLPLFVKNKMMTDLAAGLLSFLIDGNRTLLVAGTRGSGKTSLLGSVLIEIMRRYRVILLEDTLELPADALRKLGYNIQSMKVRSALSTGGTELTADEGIRTSLRMGDSALIVGEVRSVESRALYEAMRVGALANVVAGTIHGDSPYGVFDRVVNDLGVPRTSFKATDIIIVANPIRSADGLHRFRRVTQITEVRKEWEQDPLAEGAFVDLMKYDSKTDALIPTDALIHGDSVVLKAIGGQIREWAGSWDAIWENILLRARMKKTLVEYDERYDLHGLLEARDVVAMNDEFHKISDHVAEEVGFLDNKRIFFEWEESLKRYVKMNYAR